MYICIKYLATLLMFALRFVGNFAITEGFFASVRLPTRAIVYESFSDLRLRCSLWNVVVLKKESSGNEQRGFVKPWESELFPKDAHILLET